MEPRIQYAKTKDGVSIAFWTLGKGMPLVRMQPTPYSHALLEWSVPEIRLWHEPLAQRYRLIRFDHRGTGLSQRDAVDFSLRAQVCDLEAVLDRLSLERVALMALYGSGPLTIEYAARHPERVSHLILLDAYARAPDFYQLPQLQAIVSMVDKDWELFTENVSHISYGWSEKAARRFAAFMRECVNREAAKAFLEADAKVDVSGALPDVKQPTLVLQHGSIPFPPIDTAQDIASRIPDARLVVLEGTWRDFKIETALTAIDEFLGEGEEAEAAAELPEGMAVLVFADIAGSTALTEQLGDAAFRTKARELDTLLRSVIRESGGTPVEGKVLGDGVLAVFTSARQAIDCAIRCEATGEPLGLQLHLGIHAGDVIREGNNVYGGAVNIAARIAAASEPGEVLVSDTVRSLGRTSADVTFYDRGEHELKGVGEPQRLYAVRWRERGA